MVVLPSSPFPQWSLGEVIKCFVVWILVLTASWLIVGFPVVALLVMSGAFMVIGLQLELPMSAVAVVAGCILAVKVAILLITAVFLTAWGIHPHQVPGLLWLKPSTKKRL
ncbi:hypothetical protein [Acaryochloris sp. CCMEE 5410]|uniref:hypothetical protein n=1 Tax=Acaryochloris sp. CCMEE 5410 TaxID=310037 RepID=UPI0002483F72|nr:hypothetical protein [Acaryochloris sp. CCMEE 5410]KAI9134418.1 hypothetical protein ON05_014775 [Acaryochloris sp. CCMEE 5410]